MGHYFFSNASLPPLYFGVRPEMSFLQVMQLAEENFPASTLRKIASLLEYIDILNIHRLLTNQPIDTRGNLSEKELETALIEHEGLHHTCLTFLNEYETRDKQRTHFTQLLSEYLRAKEQESSGFAQQFFIHERLLRISLVAYRCARARGDIVEELKFEDPRDPFIASLLAQKDTTHFEFPFELEHLTEALAVAKRPIDEYKVIFEHQFRFAEEEGQQNMYTLDFFLAYLCQLIAIEDWEATNEQTGIGIIEGMA